MQENYAALLDLPIIRQLIKKNAKLRKENKALKSLIYSIPEFRCECRKSGSSIKVSIKKEKEDVIPVQCDTLEEDDEVVFVAQENDVKKINIVYEIDEEEEAQADEAEEADEEAQADEEAGEESGEEEEEEAQADEADAQADEEEEDDEAEAQADEEEEADDAEVEEDEEAEAQADEDEAQADEDEAQADEEEESVEEEEADEEEEEEEEAEEEADEVFVVTISGKSYYTTNKDNGKIYAIDADEEIGDEIGEFKNGKAKFYKK
jgi:hypothetical protein